MTVAKNKAAKNLFMKKGVFNPDLYESKPVKEHLIALIDMDYDFSNITITPELLDLTKDEKAKLVTFHNVLYRAGAGRDILNKFSKTPPRQQKAKPSSKK